MSLRHPLHIACMALWLCLLCTTAHAQREPRPYTLGGGGTNYSDRKPNRYGLLIDSYARDHHLFGVWVNAGYSTMFSSLPYVSPLPGGYGTAIGICYEYQSAIYKFNLGISAQWQDIRNHIGDTIFYDHSVQDARSYPYHLRYHFYERTDYAKALHLQMPLLFGIGCYNWYFLTGFKLNLTFNTWAKAQATGTTSGTYDQFLGLFYEMDNHGLRKAVPFERQGLALPLSFDVLASFETGYEWGNETRYGTKYRRKNPSFFSAERYEHRLRIAVFVDYGLCNLAPVDETDLYHIPPSDKWDFPAYGMNHAFTTKNRSNQQLHNFYAGIKLTALIGIFNFDQCVLCGDRYTTEGWMQSPRINRLHRRKRGDGKR